MKHFISGNLIAFDTETSGVDVWVGDTPFAFSFANQQGETAYFEFLVDPKTRKPILDRQARSDLDAIGALLEDGSITKVMHNAKFDCRMMELGYNIVVAGPGGPIRNGGTFHDTLIMAHNANTLELSLGLKQLGKKYCDISTEDQSGLKKAVQALRRFAEKEWGWNVKYEYPRRPDGLGKRKAVVAADYWIPNTIKQLKGFTGKITKYEGSEILCRQYAVLDAVRTMQLFTLYSDVIEEYGTHEILKLEMDLWPVIYRMEGTGVNVDKQLLQKQMAEAKVMMDEIYPRIEQMTWKGFRPKAPADTGKLFYEILNLPITKWTKGGKQGLKKKPAVDKFVIKENVHIPIIRDLAVWQSNYVAYTTFFSKFNELAIADPCHPGRTALHADYRQVGGDNSGDRGGVATGRVSSSRPNMQNVMTPENTMAVHPMHVRPAFIPRPGYVWLCTDYAGMEVYMFAAISEEPFMIKAIKEGRSIHEEMTDLIWGGENNEEGVKQMVRALSLDGTGMHSSPKVDVLWKQWGINDSNIAALTEDDQMHLARQYLASQGWSQVKAQKSVDRNNAKTTIKSLTFLKLYGGGPNKAKLLLQCEYDEAKRILDRYDTLFPGVKAKFDELMNQGRSQGYITSAWGRRLSIDREWAYRACNYMVQGSSADCMKRGMVRIDEFLRRHRLDAHVLMTIHDEIVVEVRKELLSCWFIKNICRIMCDTEGHIPIQMAVEPKVVTENWSIKHKVKYEL